jgi:hypothetical protein
MKTFKKRFLSLFSKRKKPVKETKQISSPRDELLLLKMKIAELEKNNIQLGKNNIQLEQIIRKTSETILVLQESINKNAKTGEAALQLSQAHEGIFSKIIEDKLVVFGLTNKTKVLNLEGKDPKTD